MIISLLWAAAAISMVVEPPCQPVDGEQILGRDLALAEPRLGGIDLAQDLGFAPEPGAKRVFWPAELLRIAQRNELAIGEPVHQVCFERRTRTLTESEILSAVRTWAPKGSQITVLDRSKPAAPIGALVLPQPAVIHSAPDGSVLLRGYVLFGAERRFPMWARLRFSIERNVVVASDEIAAGSEIREDQLRMERRSGGIEATEIASAASQVAGRILTRRLAAGDPIKLPFLLKPKQVNAGSVVRVEVLDGATHLSLEGRAETSGRTGDLVTVRNPSSGKAFQARVSGVDAVLVIPPGMRFGGKK